MKRLFARSEAGAHSEDRHDNSSFSGITSPPLDSRKIAHVWKKGGHRKASQNVVDKAMTTKERELSQRLWEKEAEILGLRAQFEDTVSRKEHEIQNSLQYQTTTQEALEKKDGEILELQNCFKGTLDEKDKEIEEMRRNHNRLLHTHESQLRNSSILQQNAEALVGALQEKLTEAEQGLEACKDDLFRIQPVCRVSDGDIIGAFESLNEQLINWIDNETAGFEKANPDAPVGSLFSGSEDSDLVQFLHTYPSAGEYLCRHKVNRYMSERWFGSNIHLLGLSTEYTDMRLNIEHGMAALRPPKGKKARLSGFLNIEPCLTISDSRTINIWRAETLSALAVTQAYTDLREAQIIQCTSNLFEDLSAFFPNLFGRGTAMQEFHDQVTVPAMTIVSKLQGSAPAYRLDMFDNISFKCERFTRDDLNNVTAIDLETRKTLKPGSAIVSGREGVVGDLILPLEPSLHRVNEGASDTDLRRETWLVRLDHGLGSPDPERN